MRFDTSSFRFPRPHALQTLLVRALLVRALLVRALLVQALVLLFFAPAVAGQAAPPTVHRLSLAEGTPFVPLRFGGWLVDDGFAYRASVVAPPQFGTLDLAAETYTPSPAFDEVGLDHFVVDLESSLSSQGLSTERHWFLLTRADSAEPLFLEEGFETPLLVGPVTWSHVGDANSLVISTLDPIAGSASLRVTGTGFANYLVVPTVAPASLPGDGDSGDGSNGQAVYGDVELPPPDDWDDEPFAFVGFRGDAGRRAGIELRIHEKAWEARAFGDDLDGLRRETPWFPVPHKIPVRFGLGSGPAVAERGNHGNFLRFSLTSNGANLGSATLMELAENLQVDLELGILDDAGAVDRTLTFDSIQIHHYSAASPRVQGEGFESGAWTDLWATDAGAFDVVYRKPALSGVYELALELESLAGGGGAALSDSFAPSWQVASSFLLDVAALSLRPDERMSVWSLHADEVGATAPLALLELRRDASGLYFVQARTYPPVGDPLVSGWLPISASQHRIALRWQAGPTGQIALGIDQNVVWSLEDIDNFSQRAESVRYGAWDLVPATRRGGATTPLLRLDDLVTVSRALP